MQPHTHRPLNYHTKSSCSMAVPMSNLQTKGSNRVLSGSHFANCVSMYIWSFPPTSGNIFRRLRIWFSRCCFSCSHSPVAPLTVPWLPSLQASFDRVREMSIQNARLHALKLGMRAGDNGGKKKKRHVGCSLRLTCFSLNWNLAFD